MNEPIDPEALDNENSDEESVQSPEEAAVAERVNQVTDRVLGPDARRWIVDPSNPDARRVVSEAVTFAAENNDGKVSPADVFQPPLNDEMESLLRDRREFANEQFGCAALCDESFSRYLDSEPTRSRSYAEPETGRTVGVDVNTTDPHRGVRLNVSDAAGETLVNVGAHFDLDINPKGGVRAGERTMDYVVIERPPQFDEEVLPGVPDGDVIDGVDQAMISKYIKLYLKDSVKQLIASQSETRDLATAEVGTLQLENSATQVDVMALVEKLPKDVAAELRSEL